MKKLIIPLLISGLMLALCACGTQSLSDTYMGPDFASLEATGQWDLSYASVYDVTEYGDYSLVTINNDAKYLVVPGDKEIPSGIPENITILKKPLNNVYLVASSAMDMICQIGAKGNVKMTGTKLSDWYIDEAVDAMNSGELLYAGKYSEPDYEMILSNDCSLAIENTMIMHKPETKEKLEELGIPVLVEMSSYEEHPLGRLEWIKLYGLLFDKMDEASSFYEEQLSSAEQIIDRPDTGKTVAFFYMTANGAVNIKKPNDYVPKMIRMAGGEYVPGDIETEEDNAMSTMNMQFEEFYSSAVDADILVYNSTINDDIECVSDLIKKNELFADFKAVKEGRVYESGANFYQKTTGVCEMINDLGIIINDESEDALYFISHLK